MHGDHMRHIRGLYGETQTAFGRRLGYVGSDETIKRKVIRYETGETAIEGPLEALLNLLERDAPKGDTGRRRKAIS